MRLFQVAKMLRVFTRSESGATLIETLVALAIMGTLAVTFLSGLTITSKATIVASEQATAESLAQGQMEWVKNADYVYGATEYSPAPISSSNDYAHYSVGIAAEPVHTTDDGIQKITVTVKHYDKEVIKLNGYKMNR